MSTFSRDEELENIENLQQQTRDPFQLELLGAVKKRQKKETGFDGENDRSTQRHSRELDVKMSKFLSNKQSPYQTDDSLRESSLNGDTLLNMSLGTRVINNKRTSIVNESKWRPSASIDSEDDVVEDIYSSSDDDDDIVIGSSANIFDQVKVQSGELDSKKHVKRREANEKIDPTSSGLSNIDKARHDQDRKDIKRTSVTTNNNKQKGEGDLQGRPGIQRKKGTIVTDQELEPSNSPTKFRKKEMEEGTTTSVGRPSFGRRGKLVKSDDSDDEVDAIDTENTEDVEPTPRRKSQIDDIFNNTGTRKRNSLLNVEGNVKDTGKVRGQSLEDQSPRSRSGSGRASPGIGLKSNRKISSLESEREQFNGKRNDNHEDENVDKSYHEVGTKERPASRASIKRSELRGDNNHHGITHRAKSPDHQKETYSKHRRSKSIGESPRGINPGNRATSPGAVETVRGRSKSFAAEATERVRERDSRNEDVKDRKDRDMKNKQKHEIKDNKNLGSKYSLKRFGSMTEKKNDSDSDENDDDTIGIRRPSSAALKQNERDKRRGSTEKEEKRTAPSIKRPLGADVRTKGALQDKGGEVSEGDEEQRRINGQKGKHATLSKSEKDSLSKFKIKGRTELPQSKTTPIKPNMDIKGAQSVPAKKPKGDSITPRDKGHKTLTKRSLSFTNISNIKPKSPYPENETEAENRRNSVVDSETLREQIYYDWLKQKSTKTKDEIKELRMKEKEKEEEAEREKSEKIIMSKKAFEAWQGNKEESLKEKKAKLKEDKMKEKEKQEELQQKKLDSKKYFESWKAKKEEEIVEQRQKKKEEQREKRKKEMEEKEDKLSSSKKVYENWKSKKDEVLKEKIKAKKEGEKEKRLQDIEKMEKKRKAEKLFETWKEGKQKSPREKNVLTQRAWCPSGRNSGNTIPEGVRPVIQRNPPTRSRTLSATGRLQNGTMMSMYTRM